jgi:hypothetical protein
LIKKPKDIAGEPIAEDDKAAKQTELQAQITQLPIENPLPLNKFLNLANETVVDKDKDIFISVVDHYSVNKPGEESESSEEEVEEVDIAKALRCVKLVKL